MSAKPSRLLYAFAGPAWALRARLRFALEAAPPASHREAAERAVARLEARWWADLATWTHEGGAVRLSFDGMQRLQRAVRMEVEG